MTLRRSSVTDLQDGILEVVEVDWFEALELRVSTAEVIEQRCQSITVVLDIFHNDAHCLHEPQRVTFEPRIAHQLFAVEMTETEDGLDERISTEDQQEYSRSATAEVGRQSLPVLFDHLLVLFGQHDRLWRQIVGETDVMPC